MHPNPIFRREQRERNVSFARQRGFGTLAVNAESGPLLAHIPFLLSSDGKSLEAHLVRSNPILRLLETPQDAVIAVNGGDVYISPDWYGVADQVPTWNYVAVHLRGKLARMADEEMHGVLERLSEQFEQRLLPKKPWVTDKMDQSIYTRMLRQIVPVAMSVTDIDGTWKLSQNKPDSARAGAISGIGEHGIGSETAWLAEQMDAALKSQKEEEANSESPS